MGIAAVPSNSNLELSVFGPGYGEAIAIHAGNGDWALIDSCFDTDANSPASLVYLRKLGVDPAKAVKLLVATHWHDDHIRGLADVFRACPNAKFVCSDALNSDEFFTLVAACNGDVIGGRSGVTEFHEILTEIKKRGRDSSLKWAGPERLIWKRASNNLAETCEIHTLSPSDAAITSSKVSLSHLIPQSGAVHGRVPTPSRNECSVALWVKIGAIQILLGADLEEAPQDGIGWSVVVSSETRPAGRASVLKVPHHGSITSHCDDMWTKLLEPQPVAILTPFWRGRVRLPRPADARRISNYTSKAFITASNHSQRRTKYAWTVEKTIRESTRGIRQAETPIGQVRLRLPNISDPNNWIVDCFGAASPLASAVLN